MQARRYVWLTVFFLGTLLSACAGGSGSSGFDNFPSSENAAIQTALAEQRCVAFHGLSICPVDNAAGTEPGAAPTAVPTGTPTGIVINPPPSSTATPLTTRAPSPLATRTPTPTPEQVPAPNPHVDTGINDSSIACASVADGNGCLLVLPFAPNGFPPGTIFRVAVRDVEPTSPWTIGSAPIPSGSVTDPVFDAPIAVAVAAQSPGMIQRVQLAVLAFLDPSANIPATVADLSDSGADYAFVTADLNLQPSAPQAEP
jgi:hypothetical protein